MKKNATSTIFILICIISFVAGYKSKMACQPDNATSSATATAPVDNTTIGMGVLKTVKTIAFIETRNGNTFLIKNFDGEEVTIMSQLAISSSPFREKHLERAFEFAPNVERAIYPGSQEFREKSISYLNQ